MENTINAQKTTVFQSSALAEETRDTNRKNLVPKVIFLLLGVAIIVELFIGARTLLSPIPVVGKVSGFQSGQISLVAPAQNYQIGQTIPVQIRLATGGHNSDGADVNLKYDPAALSASNSSFTRGTLYSEFPIVSVDQKNGVIKISGIVGPNASGFNGIGNFGVLSFKALKNGQTTLSIDYQANSTTHSTIIETGTAKNILSKVYNLNLNINNNSSSPTLNLCADRTYQMCRDGSGRIGTYWCTNISDGVSCQSGCFKTQTGNEQGCNVISSQ